MSIGGSVVIGVDAEQISTSISTTHFRNDVGREDLGLCWRVEELNEITMQDVVEDLSNAVLIMTLGEQRAPWVSGSEWMVARL